MIFCKIFHFICRGCSHTADSASNEWFSLELEENRTVAMVQIARRIHSDPNNATVWARGQNIKITVGNSQSYDPNEPLCLPEIADLERQSGLQDYVCTGNLHSGKYVKISRVGWIALCEVKVFTECIVESNTGYGGVNANSDIIADGTHPDWQSCRSFCEASHPSARYFKFNNYTGYTGHADYTQNPYWRTCACKTNKTSTVALSGTVSGDLNCVDRE